MNKDEAKRMWEKVKENQNKLRKCPGHKFGDVLGDARNAAKPIQCSICCGTMRSHDIYVYALGYKAAGGNPDDVARFVDGSSMNE